MLLVRFLHFLINAAMCVSREVAKSKRLESLPQGNWAILQTARDSWGADPLHPGPGGVRWANTLLYRGVRYLGTLSLYQSYCKLQMYSLPLQHWPAAINVPAALLIYSLCSKQVFRRCINTVGNWQSYTSSVCSVFQNKFYYKSPSSAVINASKQQHSDHVLFAARFSAAIVDRGNNWREEGKGIISKIIGRRSIRGGVNHLERSNNTKQESSILIKEIGWNSSPVLCQEIRLCSFLGLIHMSDS